jgi:protein involved in polysaccharide export with SLBB domain
MTTFMQTIALLSPMLLSVGLVMAAPQNSSSISPEIGGANLPALPVGPEDLIAVSVYGSQELSRTLRVSQDGHIRMPMLKAPVKVLGLMPSAIEAVIGQVRLVIGPEMRSGCP